MNIFILSEGRNPDIHFEQQATYHVDKHVVKMIAECTQMLVTALATESFMSQPSNLFLHRAMLDIDKGISQTPCKPLSLSMRKHPCTKWTAANIHNFYYVSQLAVALVNEHKYRYPLSWEHAYGRWLVTLSDLLLLHGPVFIMPQNFAVAVKSVALRSESTPHADTVAIYRDYYMHDKAGIANWKRRVKPAWWLLREIAEGDVHEY